MTSKDIIRQLQLVPHPEGGFYKEMYRSLEKMTTVEGKTRSVSTSIYFLLEKDNRSHFHRIKSDEHWFFHLGEPIEIFFIQHNELHTILLGNNLNNGELPQAVIPAHCWFAAHVKNEKGFGLVSCTVAPGFDFEDFEMAGRAELLTGYPHLKDRIENFILADT